MRLLALLTMVLFAAPGACASEDPQPVTPEALATRIAQLLSEHDLESATSLLHYPPAFTEEQRQEDAAGVLETLRFLVEQFGSVSQIRREKGRVSFFEVGAGGGNMPYWEGISPHEVTDFIYTAHFSNFGPGLLAIRTVRHPTIIGPAVQWINLGLSSAREDSKRKIIAVTKGLLKRKGRQLPPNIEELLERGIRPVERREAPLSQIP